jgi:hypothetical protein
MSMTKRGPVIEVIDDDTADVLRRLTPAQSLASAHGMWRYARQRLIAQVQREHPDWDEQARCAEVARRLLGSS